MFINLEDYNILKNKLKKFAMENNIEFKEVMDSPSDRSLYVFQHLIITYNQKEE